MSLEAKFAAPRIVATIAPKILTLDIERVKGTAAVAFWDLGEYKNRRIHADDVTSWPRTICLAWRWYGAKRVEFAAEWLDGGYEGMLRQAWELYNEADIVVGHNLQGFDTKKLSGEWKTIGLPKPSPWKTIDTLKVARSQFGFESNTLDAILTRLNIQGKTDKYNHDVAMLACSGDKAAQTKLRRYNQGDIVASEALYDAVRGWIPNHPHIGLWSGDGDCCGSCGGELKANDWCYTAVTAYAQYCCTNCGAWYRRNDIKSRVTTRPAR
jgi:hypothetical protein